jgi:LacI family repressor for deo operon, udp, cdd, tsx, nupC, and nupG
MRMIDAMLHNKPLTEQSVVLPHQLIIRRSSGAQD